MIPLAAQLDISAAEALRQQLADALGSGEAILLDGSAIERLTTPCIQVILSLKKSAAQRQQDCHLIDASEGCCQAFERLGLTNQLEEMKRDA